jgi:hypothetical protein
MVSWFLLEMCAFELPKPSLTNEFIGYMMLPPAPAALTATFIPAIPIQPWESFALFVCLCSARLPSA